MLATHAKRFLSHAQVGTCRLFPVADLCQLQMANGIGDRWIGGWRDAGLTFWSAALVTSLYQIAVTVLQLGARHVKHPPRVTRSSQPGL